MNIKQFALQVKMARGALGWSPQELAEQAAISLESVNKAEKADATLLPAYWRVLQQALEHAGIEFREDGAIKLNDNRAYVAIVASPSMPCGARLMWPTQSKGEVRAFPGAADEADLTSLTQEQLANYLNSSERVREIMSRAVAKGSMFYGVALDYGACAGLITMCKHVGLNTLGEFDGFLASTQGWSESVFRQIFARRRTQIWRADAGFLCQLLLIHGFSQIDSQFLVSIGWEKEVADLVVSVISA